LSRHRRLNLELPSDREDELTAVLWWLDPLGMEIAISEGRSRVDTHFLGRVRASAEWLLELWLEPSRHQVREVVEKDWLSAYRSVARPRRATRVM